VLSQKRPEKEVRIDYAYVPDFNSEMPSDTFAYTVFEPFIMNFDRSVNFNSFWLRLHQLPSYYQKGHNVADKIVRIYHKGVLVVESQVMLTTTEWYYMKRDDVVGD
jgi:hypothetical protein